jgi:hypothetical protein
LLREIGGPPFGNFILLACYTEECNRLPLITPFGVTWPDYVFASAFVRPSAAALEMPDVLPEIRFERGGASAVVDLELEGRGVVGYQLGIGAGQDLMLSVDAPNLYAYVLDPNGELLPAEAFSAGSLRIPQRGRYTILIYGQTNAQMRIEIPPAR